MVRQNQQGSQGIERIIHTINGKKRQRRSNEDMREIAKRGRKDSMIDVRVDENDDGIVEMIRTRKESDETLRRRRGKRSKKLKQKERKTDIENKDVLDVIVIYSSDEEASENEAAFAERSETQIIDSDFKLKPQIKAFQMYECPICFDSPEQTVALACGHCYCFECMFKAFSHSTGKKTSAPCPLCRRQHGLKEAVALKFKIKDKSVPAPTNE